MSENVPEHAQSSERASAGPPAPAAYGGRDGSGPAEGPTAEPGVAPPPPGTFYGPVHRYARPPAEVHHGATTATATFPAALGPPAAGAWPPPTPAGPPPGGYPGGPAAWPPAAWSLAAPPPPGWGPAPPWGAAAPWSPPRRHDYASWGRRVAAALIDSVPTLVAAVVLVAGYLPTYLGLFRGDLAVPPRSWLVGLGTLLYLGAFGLAVYNFYFLAGRTGQTYGKRVMKIWLVSQITGRPIGAFNAFLRNLLHVVDSFGYVGYLWPLWDDEHQTLADKLAQTVVVRTPVQPLTELERRKP